MTKKEYIDYIPLYQLQLLTRFMLNDEGMRLCYDMMALSENNRYVVDEYDLLIRTIKGIEINETPVFSIEPYSIPEKIKGETDEQKQKEMIEIYIEKSRDCVIRLGISQDKLRSYLKEYSKYYEKNDVEVKNSDETNINYESLLTKFKESINTELNLKHYKIKEGKYLPILLIGYFKETVKFNDNRIFVEFPTRKPDDEGNICIVEMVDCDGLEPVLIEEFWDVRFNVNISEFMRCSKKKNLTDKKGEDDYLKEILEEVNKLTEAGQDKICYEKLEDILKDKLRNKRHNEAKKIVSNKINILNAKYKKQHDSMLLGKKVKDSSGDYYPILIKIPEGI